MALLTLVQQNLYKPISQNWANHTKISGGYTNFEQLQAEVENTDLKKLIGPAFLYAIQQTPTDVNYVKLLDGIDFEDCDGNTIEFKGIRYQLAFINYSRYVGKSDQADTFTGMVRQNRSETSPLSEGAIKRERHDAESIAMQDFEIMKQYLNDNTDVYTLWCAENTKKIFTPKLTTIRKTYN